MTLLDGVLSDFSSVNISFVGILAGKPLPGIFIEIRQIEAHQVFMSKFGLSSLLRFWTIYSPCFLYLVGVFFQSLQITIINHSIFKPSFRHLIVYQLS